jgi:YD repeat-containing protein
MRRHDLFPGCPPFAGGASPQLTPTAYFGYDQTTVTPSNGWTPPSPGLRNALGLLSSSSTTYNGQTNTATVYSYDAMGRVVNFWQCTPYNCANSQANPLMWATQYTYDLAGDVTSWVHPARGSP